MQSELIERVEHWIELWKSERQSGIATKRLIEELLQALKQAQTHEWLPIESAPRDGTAIDVFTKYERIPDVHWNDKKLRWEHWFIGDYDSMQWVELSNEPLYWQPLPLPPKQIKQGGV